MFELPDDRRFTLTIVALSTISLTVSLSSTSLSNAIPVITNQFHGTDTQAFWSGTAYLLCSAVFQPAFAVASHHFGRKPLFISAVIFFLAGSALATGSGSFEVLLSARSIQGFGGGGLLTLSEILIADLTPLRERGRWIGLLSMMWAVGCVCGPIVGGALAHENIWRWIFAINLPLASASLALICISLRPSEVGVLKADKGRIDWVGFGLFIPSMASFLIPITWGGEMFPWASWHTLVPLLTGTAGLISFVSYEIWVAREPFLLGSIFRDGNSRLIYLQTFTHGLVVWCLLYYLPLYYQAVQSYTPLMSGVALLPETFTISLSAGLVGMLITATGRYYSALWIGWATVTTGVGLLYLLNTNTAVYEWVLINLVVGLGTGSLFTSANLAIQANKSSDEMSHALGFFAFFRTLGQSIGVAIGGTTFDNLFNQKLRDNPALGALAKKLGTGAAALVQSLKVVPEDDPRKPQLIQAYADSLRVIWLVLCGCAGVALLASLFVKRYSLGSRKSESNEDLGSTTSEEKAEITLNLPDDTEKSMDGPK
ncbi:hypothetical protein N7452_003699 [Penicillium brevicompactum]|uniref:Major facilitator superfamily (MFS) profile domain-containing protein n=1 Tax=Penicillium brevicompactum TaxID=5074 RepID=A0A9W9QU04_PENBR|nr:hypothetical protein N7452_003699 [Penicillium brevicompactum]